MFPGDIQQLRKLFEDAASSLGWAGFHALRLTNAAVLLIKRDLIVCSVIELLLFTNFSY